MKNIVNLIKSRSGFIIIALVISVNIIIYISKNTNKSISLDINSLVQKDTNAIENGLLYYFEDIGCDVNITNIVDITCENDFSISWNSIKPNYLLGTISIIKPSFISDKGNIKFSSLTFDMSLKQIYTIVDNISSKEPIELNAFQISFENMDLENKSNNNSGINKIFMEDFDFKFNGKINQYSFEDIFNQNNFSDQLIDLSIKGQNFNFIISDEMINEIESEIPLNLDDFNINEFNLDLKLDDQSFIVKNSNLNTNMFDANINLDLVLNESYLNKSTINNCTLTLSETNDMIEKLVAFIELYTGNEFFRDKDAIILEVSGSLENPIFKNPENHF